MTAIPTVEELIESLNEVRFHLRHWNQDNSEVRLQVWDGNWLLHFGDAQYDHNHRGLWGCNVVTPYDTNEALRDIAEDLIDQVLEQEAQNS